MVMLLRVPLFIHVLLALSLSVCNARSVHERRGLTHRNIHLHARAGEANAPSSELVPLAATTTVVRRQRNRCKVPRLANDTIVPSDLPALLPSSSNAVPSASATSPNSQESPSHSSQPTSSEPPTSTPIEGDDDDKPPTGGSSRYQMLFPVSGYTKSWSTCPDAPSPRDLSDDTLRPGRVLRTTMYRYGQAPDGRRAIRAHYPQKSYTFKHSPQGGFSFYAPGPQDVDLTTAKEATFGYSVYFPEGFAFNKGGKLPGLYGGNSDEQATSCSGGRRDTACFSVRLMWRSEGDGEFYTYLPPGFNGNDNLCDVPPFSECNPVYGASVGRGVFRFATGAWTTVSERVQLNDPGASNGQIELFVNGRSVLEVKGLVLRDSAAGKIRGIQAQTFFGGSQPDWASPKDQDVYFSDFSVAITQTF